MPGIDPDVIVHRLNDDKNIAEKVQARRAFNPNRYLAINEEVKKLLSAGFIREAKYPKWVANVVMVKNVVNDAHKKSCSLYFVHLM